MTGGAYAADLVVASQTDPEWPGTDRLDIADRLAMESGRPVLIVANAGVHQRVGERVLVAWNARREAARAAFDALPILRRAREVKAVCVNPQSEREGGQDAPASDICAALVRHNVKCEATGQIAPTASVGETLLGYAKAWNADLLVMAATAIRGCASSSWAGRAGTCSPTWRIPVLMSH